MPKRGKVVAAVVLGRLLTIEADLVMEIVEEADAVGSNLKEKEVVDLTKDQEEIFDIG
ncbi:hypothetical protein F511_06576 [Dorcoceras hygrometricum]|uniref:Uncharacterized protein n=1 Tax=Dorcoceras hygrometricum TaxID=472368 RepID=A0A2Z7CB36_9LAMI|nr:hypothetical protein F511_06576 [Dorcoceras hygrometricum]